MSRTTRGLGLGLWLGTLVLAANSAEAGTVGTAEAERARLQDELTSARNALDALVLQPGMKLDDPRVREKAAIVDEKTKAFRRAFESDLQPPSAPITYPDTNPNRENGERAEKYEGSDAPTFATGVGKPAPITASGSPPPEPAGRSEPATVLSGDGIQSEITYSKKPKPGKGERPIPKKSPRVEHAEEPVPAETTAPDATGLSEIQYPKKRKP